MTQSINQSLAVESTWTFQENKRFELALLIVPEGIPGRWQKIAEAVPGKTVAEVIAHYQALENDVYTIESGRVSVSYSGNEDRKESAVRCNSELGTNQISFEPEKGAEHGKRERKKGTAWTTEEHRNFLKGLKKYGRGDWRSISRNCVVTRTSTQVASHAQKYFLRKASPNTNKKRSSIHDITTTADTTMSPPPTQSPQPPTETPMPPLMPPQQPLAHDNLCGFQGGAPPQMGYEFYQHNFAYP